MACPRCSHRLLGLLTESAGRFNGSLPSHSRPSLHSSLRQTRSKAFSTRPALTKSLVLRLPNMKQFDNSDSSSGDAAAPTITNSEADAEIHRAAKAVAESADPDTAELRDELGLDSLRTSAPQKKPERQPKKLTKVRYEGKGKTPEEKQERRQEREQYFADRRERAKGSKNMGGKGAELGAQDGSKAHKDKEGWKVQKEALKEKFGSESWQPRKKLSPDTMDGIRNLHRSDPDRYTTPVLAEEFKISPEAIRRILKSKWQPSEEETEARRVRWEKRGEKIWNKQAEMGVKPPKKWREMGVGSVKGGKDFKPAWKKQGSSRGNNNNRNQRDQAGHANDPGPDWGSEDIWSDRIF